MDSSYDRLADLSRPNPSRRNGRTVTHPAQPWTRTTHTVLAHLRASRFPASPRVVDGGFDADGNEVLEWIDGEVHATGAWPEPLDSLFAVGRMLRQLHHVMAVFARPSDAVWMPWTLRQHGPGTIVSHGNIAPWHVVFRDGRPVGLIGWEYAGPVDPVREVAATGWYCAQLFDDDVADRTGLPGVETRGRWLKAFLDGYGLPPALRANLVTLMIEFAVEDTGSFARTHNFSPTSTDAEHLWLLSWQSRAALWMLEHREPLTRVISHD